jgi:hypothetical protein
MASPTDFSALLNSLKEYHLFSYAKHKELTRILQDQQTKHIHALSSKEKLLKPQVNRQTLEKIAEISSFLIENDQKFLSSFQSLQEKLSCISNGPNLSSTIKCVTPNEIKVLKLKINRLHNRGSLTNEEAQSMLGKINVLPVSPTNEDSDPLCYLKTHFETSADVICDENPVTETRENRQALERSFSKEIRKKFKSMKRIPKRSSTPAKKILRNASLPKTVIITNSRGKDKLKAIKVKSKSPHSFL